MVPLNIRLVATDLDGTLVDSGRFVSEYTQRVVAKYAARGVRFAFCTGRVANEIDYVMGALPQVQYAVMANGAYGLSLPTRTRIFSNSLPMETVRRIARVFAHTDHMLELMTAEGVLSEAEKLPRLDHYGAEYLAEVIHSTRTPVEDMAALLEARREPVDKTNIFFTSPEARDALLPLTAKIDADASHPEHTNIEFTARSVNKGSGLARLAGLLGIRREEILALGDNNNDVPLLNYAGFAVAMCNGEQEARDAADYVTEADNDHDGAARAIEAILG